VRPARSWLSATSPPGSVGSGPALHLAQSPRLIVLAAEVIVSSRRDRRASFQHMGLTLGPFFLRNLGAHYPALVPRANPRQPGGSWNRVVGRRDLVTRTQSSRPVGFGPVALAGSTIRANANGECAAALVRDRLYRSLVDCAMLDGKAAERRQQTRLSRKAPRQR